MQEIDSVLLDLPAEVVTKDQDIVSSYVTDFRRQYFGATTALLRPRNTAEVQAIVRACAKHKVGLVPQGGIPAIAPQQRRTLMGRNCSSVWKE